MGKAQYEEKSVILLLALMLMVTACDTNSSAEDLRTAEPAKEMGAVGLATKAGSFSDIPANADCVQAAAWANRSGLVQGCGNGLFGTNAPVSVEQLEGSIEGERTEMQEITLTFNGYAYPEAREIGPDRG